MKHEISLTVHHGVPRVEVTVEGADAKHERAVDAEQVEHVRPGERSGLEVVLEGWMRDFFHHQDVLI